MKNIFSRIWTIDISVGRPLFSPLESRPSAFEKHDVFLFYLNLFLQVMKNIFPRTQTIDLPVTSSLSSPLDIKLRDYCFFILSFYLFFQVIMKNIHKMVVMKNVCSLIQKSRISWLCQYERCTGHLSIFNCTIFSLFGASS